MANQEEARRKVDELVRKFRWEENRRQSEADVRSNYVDWLFSHLGWDVWRNDPEHRTGYQREAYVRGAGYVDVGLEIKGRPVLFLEAKKFGLIEASAERKGDRTTEEKQAFRYARGKGITYAILPLPPKTVTLGIRVLRGNRIGEEDSVESKAVHRRADHRGAQGRGSGGEGIRSLP